jgi:seryl-tRNA synthetase
MKDQFITWIKQNWKSIKNILIGLGILLLLLSFVSNWIQSDRYNTIKQERKELKKEKELIKSKFDSLNIEYVKRDDDNIRLQLRLDSTKKVSDAILKQMKDKERQYLNTIAELTNIPSDTIYKITFTYNLNVNNELLKYPYGGNQIRYFYQDHISLNYNLGLVKDLNNTLDLCKNDNVIKSTIIGNKDIQLGTLNEKLKLNDELITNLTEDNKLLNKSYKSERFWKGVWRIGAITTSGLLVYKSLK